MYFRSNKVCNLYCPCGCFIAVVYVLWFDKKRNEIVRSNDEEKNETTGETNVCPQKELV